MKKNRSAETLHGQAGWRRFGATALLLCVMAGLPSTYAQDPSANQATLNFVGADIESVIKAIGHYTRTTFIIDPRVKGTINLVSEKPVNKAQAMQMLTSALRLQGFAVVKVDGFTKVVPEADAKLQAGPIQAEVRGDQIATQIFRLNYESANNLVQVLRPLISPNNTINVNPGNNSIVITDYADNLKRLGRIIAALDSPAVGDMDVVPVRHAIASDLAVTVNRLLEQGGGPVAGGDAGRVTVLADTRTNSLILRAPSAARANLAKSLIAKLDQPTAQAGNVHVVYLRNADAIRLAQTLRAVVASDTAGQTPAATPQQPQTQQAMVSPGQQAQLGQGALTPSAPPTPAALPSGGPAGFIQADPATNALIITANEAVYRNLRTVIDQLDARRAQVYVESLIVEVTADKAAEFGIQWAGLTGTEGSKYRLGVASGFGQGGSNLINQAIARATPNAAPLPPGSGINVGIFRQVNGSLTLGALARALESDGNANILSMPNLITLDNEEARIIVGQNVPFLTGSFTTAAAGAQNPFQTIERRDVGLSLRVRPQVSEGGTVKMAIYQETSNIQPTSNASDIITNKRSIETNVLVDDGNIIVLGGLIEDRATDGEEKVPVFGDIPVVGNLFKYRTRRGNKTNLMVFLRPTVIRTNEQSVNVTGDRYDFIRNIQMNTQVAPSAVLPEVNVPVLPPMQDGRAVGGSLLNVPPPMNKGNEPSTPPSLVPPAVAPPTDQNSNRQQ